MSDAPIRLEDHVAQDTSPPELSQSATTNNTATTNVTETPPAEHIDILYENQRGSFLCGIPLFSSNSLLNFDPKPWVTSSFTPSPVNITNAQVPDPSWEWAWKTWYVDMSHDVDEEGWEYSVWFRGWSWHGSHPWFHSFVRRRRWLRRRVKRKIAPRRSVEERRKGEAASVGASVVPSTFVVNSRQAMVEEETPEEIRDVPSLNKSLKKAPIDREKIVVVRRFVEMSGEELHYLEEQIPSIMSSLVFQSSRRQLLTLLTQSFDDASAHRKHHEDTSTPEGDAEKRRIDNLLKAVKAADEQVRKLEYWSDIRHMVREGKAPAAVDTDRGWGRGWMGVDASGPSHDVQTPSTEEKERTESEERVDEKGKGTGEGK